MRLVKQRDEYGCGLACVAMVAGRPYSAIRKALGSNEVGPTQLRELREIMRQHGIVADERLIPLRTRTPFELPFDALIKMNPRRGGKEWHWAVWDHRSRRILDPRSPAYRRRKFVSYVRLRRTGSS
jgi:ABC-type bacteriocin/lantibiotic exporter with double-glycine peptidase domain